MHDATLHRFYDWNDDDYYYYYYYGGIIGGRPRRIGGPLSVSVSTLSGVGTFIWPLERIQGASLPFHTDGYAAAEGIIIFVSLGSTTA